MSGSVLFWYGRFIITCVCWWMKGCKSHHLLLSAEWKQQMHKWILRRRDMLYCLQLRHRPFSPSPTMRAAAPCVWKCLVCVGARGGNALCENANAIANTLARSLRAKHFESGCLQLAVINSEQPRNFLLVASKSHFEPFRRAVKDFKADSHLTLYRTGKHNLHFWMRPQMRSLKCELLFF